ncbi:MAG: hypothetical protein H7333_00365, partial [Bdellovibrionales bacterium]|nr:hypothetical protein [Oligoflexia bacterium]
MTEQWFLDLDGTRSGPYHTPEIMSLIAEGEVLPHHRISTSLKDQPWVTVLDWRLDQAKISHTSPNSRTFRSEISAVEGITPQTTPVKEPDLLEESIADESEFLRNPEPELHYEAEPELPPESKTELPIAEPPHPQAKIKLEPRSATFTPPPSPLAPDSAFENYPEEIPSELVPASPAASAPPGPPKLSPLNENRSKRDPMAEMFDMLQKTKKREISQAPVRDSGISVIADDPGPKKSIPFSKTLGIGLGVIFIGFALGQLFQTSAPPTTTPNASATKASPSPASAASATPSTLLVDRSTD